MGKVLILNGSPRAPKSNSRRYAEIFSTACKLPSDYFNISKTNHAALCQKMLEYSDVLLVFPFYADSLPVGVLDFLKYLEVNPPERKPVVSVHIPADTRSAFPVISVQSPVSIQCCWQS